MPQIENNPFKPSENGNYNQNLEPTKMSGRSLALLIGVSAVTTFGGTLLGPVGVVGTTAITAGTLAYYINKSDHSKSQATQQLKPRITSDPPKNKTTEKTQNSWFNYLKSFVNQVSNFF